MDFIIAYGAMALVFVILLLSMQGGDLMVGAMVIATVVMIMIWIPRHEPPACSGPVAELFTDCAMAHR